MRTRKTLLSPIAVALLALAAFAQDPADPEPVVPRSTEEIQKEVKQAKEILSALEQENLEAAREGLGGIPITEDERDEWIETVRARVKALESQAGRTPLPKKGDLERSLAELDTDLEDLAGQAPPRPGPEITKDGVAEKIREVQKLTTDLESANRALGAMRERREAAGALETTLPGEIARLQEALDGERGEGDLSRYRRETLERSLGAAEQSRRDALAFLDVAELLAQVRQREVDLAKGKLRRVEAFVEEARSILKERGLQEAAAREEEARRLDEEAARERDPIESFKKEIDAEIERIGAEAILDEGWLSRIQNLRSTQKSQNSRLEILKFRLESRFREGSGVSGRSAKLLLSAKGRIERKREELQDYLWPRLEEEEEEHSEARAELQDRLWEIEEAQEEESAKYLALLDGLSGDQVEAAARAYTAKLKDLETALETREKGDFDVIDGELLEVRKIYRARAELLEELNNEVLNRIIWIQDDDPLGPKVLAKIPEEIEEVAKALGGSEAREDLSKAVGARTAKILLALAGIVVLVVSGFLLFRRLRTHEVERSGRGGRLLGGIQRFLAALVISLLAPVCLVAAGLLVGLMDLPETYDRLGSSLLFGLAGIFFVRRFARALFRENGIIVEELNAPEEVARQLWRFFRWVGAGLFFLWLPWWLLGTRVFTLVHIPRLLYTTMLVYFSLLLLSLLRPRGAVVLRITGHPSLWHRIWTVIYFVVALGMAAIVGMDALGYRLGAELLVGNVIETFGAAFFLVGLYFLITALFRQALPRLARRWWAAESGESTERLTEKVKTRITRFAGLAAVVLGVILLADSWGVDEQLSQLLESVRLRTVDAESDIHLTLWNVFIALVWILGAHFVVRNLAMVFEATLFTRLEASDPGSKYVVVTVSKYIILLIGYSAAVTSLHISFESLGWLLAAASVGLGFGLREIVANFVSGLILFVERPIKVGDFVTVGDTLGTVEKISIRATQVLSRDRKVIIIPNRLFISEQVVNWSHNDNVIRITIHIGVAYGTDVEKVREVLLEIVRKEPLVRRDPPPQALLLTFGESSLDIQLRVFTTILSRRKVQDRISTEITRRFEEEGIEIPFPQRDLNVRSVEEKLLLDDLRESREDGGQP